MRNGTSRRLLRGIAAALTGAGALIVLIGAVLPWAHFTLLGVAVAVPGILSIAGCVTAALGLIALAGTFWRWPLVGVLLGVTALGIGGYAVSEAGRGVIGHLLAANNALAPVNARLAQAGLPAIEPFGGSIGPRRSYVGPGPLWVFWGGGAVALGSAMRFAIARLDRTCSACGQLWQADREVGFCPLCGTLQDDQNHCRSCGQPLAPGDRFCTRCGTSAAPVAPAAPAPPAGLNG